MTFWLFKAPNYRLKNVLRSRFKMANIGVCFCVSKTQSVAFDFYKFGFWSREILKLERYWRFWMSIFLVLAENHPKKHVFWVVSHDTRMPNRWAKVRFLLVWYPPSSLQLHIYCTGACKGWSGFFADQNIIFVSTCSYRRGLSEKLKFLLGPPARFWSRTRFLEF